MTQRLKYIFLLPATSHLLRETQVPGSVHIQTSHRQGSQGCCLQHPKLTFLVGEDWHENCSKVVVRSSDGMRGKLGLS